MQLEHETVLENIKKALEIVDNGNLTQINYNSTPERLRSGSGNLNNIHLQSGNGSPSPRLREKISALFNSTENNITNTKITNYNNNNNNNNNNSINNNIFNSPIQNTRNSHHHPPSSPLSPAVEKSHITFDILNDLENHQYQQQHHIKNKTIEMGNLNLNLQKNSSSKRRVNFTIDENECNNDLSMASQEYLKKYGLI